jgi:protein involved in polysaccharide export with SLBB domain
MLAPIVALLASGCGGSSLPRLPTIPSDVDGFVQAPDAELTGLDEDPPRALTLMPGDVVNLQMISGTDSAALGLTVDERGVLHVPLAGDVDVSGLSLTEAEARIETALRPFDQTVRVTIIVAEPNGQRATVVGAVTTPGRHTVVPGMRLADLFALAGGGLSTDDEEGTTIPMSDLAGARLVRSGQVLPVSLMLAIMGNPRHNVRLRPGDHLYVPPAVHSLVSVLGEVHAARVHAVPARVAPHARAGLRGRPHA